MPDTPTSTTPTTTDDLDDQLRLIAASFVRPAPFPPDLHDAGFGAVVTRHDAARRRALVPVAAAAACVLAVTGLVALTQWGGGDPAPASDDDSATAADVATIADPAQPLVIDDWAVLPADGSEPAELPLNGRSARTMWLRPDGDLVVLGPKEPSTPTEKLEVDQLAVIAPDGEVLVERDVEMSLMLALDGHEAILLRTTSEAPEGSALIIAHDIETGAERTILDGDPALAYVMGPQSSTVAQDHLLSVSEPWSEGGEDLGTEPCVLGDVDLVTGERSESPLDFTCVRVANVAASPDGSQVAVAYLALTDETGGDPLPAPDGYGDVVEAEMRLAVIDAATGDVTLDQRLSEARADEYLGSAWDDDSTVRVATIDHETHPDWRHDDLTADQISVEQIAVG